MSLLAQPGSDQRLSVRRPVTAPPRVRLRAAPGQDHPLPGALDDGAAARLLRAPQNDARLLVRVTVEMLLRTGLRVSEYTGPRAGAVVQIGAGPWLHVPVGKLREDRYLPLHPHLVALIDHYRRAHVDPSHPLLLPPRLLAAARFAGTALICGGADPGRRDLTNPLISALDGGSGLPRLDTSRLRATWLADAAELLGLATFMHTAGISCSQRLGDLVAGPKLAGEAGAVRLLGGAARR